MELGDRHANVRGAQRLRQATRRVRRINGRKVRVPRCVRRLVLPDEVLLIVQPGHQLIHIGHVRHLLPELLRAQLVARLSQAVQQQLEPVVEIVEAAARALAAALDDLLRTPGRHQQTPPQDRLRLRRGLRHQRVHQESRCLIPVEHRDRHVVLQDVEVGIAHPRMLCQRRNHRSPVRQVKPFDLLQVLPQLLERAPQRRRGLLGRAGNLTPHLIIRRPGRVKGNPRLRSLQQRIHHDRVPSEMALPILRHRVRSIHRTRRTVVLRVTTQHRSRLLTVVLILVDQLGRHLAEREVTAEHIARHPQQLTHLEPAERRHQRRAGIHPTQPVPPALILRSDRALLRVRLLVDHLTDDPLQQRNRRAGAVLLVVLPVGAPQVQGALAVELRDGNVRHRQHRVHIGDTLVDGVLREVPEHLNHTADRGVLHQHRIQLALRHTGAHPGVLLRHLRVDAALLFGVLLRTGAEAGVVQALPLTEDVIATGIRPQALRHRRSPPGNHTPHGGGIRVRRVRRILHVLRVFLGVRRRNRTLRQHQGPANLGVHGEPDVRPGVLRQTLHIRLTGDGESLEELVLRLRIATPDVHDQTIQRLVDPRDTPVLIQHPLLEVREQIHDGGHQGRAGRGNLADHLDARHLIAWSRYDQRGLLVVRAQEGARPQLHVLARVHHQASQRLQLIAVEVSAHALHRSIRHQDDAVAPARLRVRLGAAGVLQRNLRQEQLHGVRVVRGRPLQDRSDRERRVHTLLLRDRERTIRPRLLRLRRINDLPGILQILVQSIHHGGLGSLVCRIAVEQIGLLLQVVPPGFGLLPDTGVPLLVGIQARPLLDLLQALHLVGEVLRKLTDREHRMMVIPLRGTLRHQPRRVRRLIGRLPHRLVHGIHGGELALREHIAARRVKRLLLGRNPSSLLHHLRQRSHLLELGLHLTGMRGLILLPLGSRHLRLTDRTLQRVVLQPPLRRSIRHGAAGTDGHTGTHRSTRKERIPHRAHVHEVPVRQRIQRLLGTFLRTFTDGVDHRLGQRGGTLGRIRRHPVQVIRRDARTRTTLRQHRTHPGRAVLRKLAGRQHRQARTRRHDLPILHHEAHAAEFLDIATLRPGSRQEPERTGSLRLLAHTQLRRALHDAATQPQLQGINADHTHTRSTRGNVDVSLIVVEDVVVRATGIVERLATGGHQLTDATGDAASHLRREQRTPSRRPEGTHATHQATGQVRNVPAPMPLALTGHRVSRVVRGLPIAHGAAHPTELRVGDALHQVGHRGHHVHRHTGPALRQR